MASFHGVSPHVVVHAHSNWLSIDMQRFSAMISEFVWLSSTCVHRTRIMHNHQQS